MPAVASCPYSASKAGAASFIEALHFELKNRIEVFSWDCGGVSTKINPFKVGFRSNTQQAAAGCFKDIGKERRSFGSWQHEVEGMGTVWLPKWVQNRITVGMAKKHIQLNQSI